MEWSCDWLHLFGGHGFNSLSAGRAKCSWVLWVVTQCPKKAKQNPPHCEAPGHSVDLNHTTISTMQQFYRCGGQNQQSTEHNNQAGVDIQQSSGGNDIVLIICVVMALLHWSWCPSLMKWQQGSPQQETLMLLLYL